MQINPLHLSWPHPTGLSDQLAIGLLFDQEYLSARLHHSGSVPQSILVDAATKDATDLSAFVKRKPAASQSSQQPDSFNKRQAEQITQDNDAKRARVSDEKS